MQMHVIEGMLELDQIDNSTVRRTLRDGYMATFTRVEYGMWVSYRDATFPVLPGIPSFFMDFLKKINYSLFVKKKYLTMTPVPAYALISVFPLDLSSISVLTLSLFTESTTRN